MSAAARLTFALALSVVAGCAPALLWYGHDPGRQRHLEIRAEHGQEWLVEPPAAGAPARRSAAFDELAVADLAWSPDGRHFALPGRRGEKWSVVTDFAESAAWDGVAAIAWSADGRHLVYAVEAAGRWRVVHDGQPGPPHEGLIDGTLGFSPNGRRWGYGVFDGGCARVVLEGRAGPCHAGVRVVALGDAPAQDLVLAVDRGTPVVLRGDEERALPGLLAFATDVRRGRWAATVRQGSDQAVLLATDVVERAQEVRDLGFAPDGTVTYAARRGGAWFFVLGATVEGPHARLRRPVFSATGGRHGYVAFDAAGAAAVVVDGARLGAWPDADGLVFSVDGRRLAFVVRRDDRAAIVCGDSVHAFDLVIETSVVFSADGAHWAALVGDRGRRRLSIVVDGDRHRPFDSRELFGAQARDAGSPERLRHWVSAELERHLRGGTP